MTISQQCYKTLRNMDGDPWTRLQSAVIMQAFDDYIIYCKLLTGRRTVKGDYTKDPHSELCAIREYIAHVDTTGAGILTRALEAYCRKKHVRDAWRATA